MKLDYNRLSELLNSFGLSLKIENGNAIFVDVETNSPMKSYIVYCKLSARWNDEPSVAKL